jgi:DNA-binding CsgD family transcriptional regulator
MGRVGALAPRLEWEEASTVRRITRENSAGRQAKRMQAISVLLEATEFSLMNVLAGAGSLRLVPVVDSAAPQMSPLTQMCLGGHAQAFAKAAMASAVPAIWHEGDAGPETCWARRIAPPAPRSSGIVFPLPTGHGGGSIAIFSAPRNLDDETLCQAHLECFGLLKPAGNAKPAGSGSLPALSKRELECLKLTADGLTSEEIATRLGLSVHTANQYLANTTQKLNAVNRMHAVAKALRAGLFD